MILFVYLQIITQWANSYFIIFEKLENEEMLETLILLMRNAWFLLRMWKVWEFMLISDQWLRLQVSWPILAGDMMLLDQKQIRYLLLAAQQAAGTLLSLQVLWGCHGGDQEDSVYTVGYCHS